MSTPYHMPRTIIGIVGNVISFGLFLSPVPTFWQIYKKKATEEFSAVPYLATVLNCLLWVFYGLPLVTKDSYLVSTINGVGLVIELIYLGIYFFYATKKQKTRYFAVLIGEGVFFAALVLGIMLGTQDKDRRKLVLGIFCIIFNICMYSSPLTVMKKVITTKSVQYMPFWLSVVSFCNGLIWTSYGFLPIDYNLLVPNGLGVLSTAVQLILYAIYCKSDASKAARKESELPTVNPPTGSSVAPASDR